MNTDPLAPLHDPDALITMRRGDLVEILGEYALPPWRGAQGETLGGDVPPQPIAAEVIKRIEAAALVPPQAGDRVVDGGLMGTLVRCPTCGDGLMHRPDADELERLAPRGGVSSRVRGVWGHAEHG